MGKFYKLNLVICLLLTVSAFAQTEGGNEPLSFKSWKEQQLVEAQNQVARVSNRIVLLKAGKLRPEEVAVELNQFGETEGDGPKLTARAQRILSTDVLLRLEREQSRSQKNLEFAIDLGIEQYFLGYLSQFQESPTALAFIAHRLSKEEVAELLRLLLKANQQNAGSGKTTSSRPLLSKLQTQTMNN